MPVALDVQERIRQQRLDFSDLESLLAAGPPHPYAAYPDLFPPRELARYALSTARETIERNRDTTFWRTGPQGLSALVAWSPLAWDSEQFGFPAGRIELLFARGEYQEARRLKSSLVAEALEGCSGARIRHVTARVDTGDMSSIHALEKNGFEIIDQIQTLGFRLSDAPAVERRDNPCKVGLFALEHLNDILSLARTLYQFDRFHSDPSLPNGVADRLHEAWMRNSCLNGTADAVLVATVEDRVASYVTVKVDLAASKALGKRMATIVLVATAEWARSKGMARSATLAALDWCRDQGVAAVLVGTQLRNIAAAGLYQSCGFRLVGTSLTLRKVLQGGPGA